MPQVINCIVVDDEQIAREIIEQHISKVDALHLVGSCKNAVEAFNLINNKKIDLIFLDISMPEISGLSFAKSINENYKVIFTTAYREYAVDGFDLRAVDYLLKPVSFERFIQAINKFTDEHLRIAPADEVKSEVMEKNDYFFVRAERKMIKIAFSEILYLESIGDYLKIHLSDKVIMTRETITNIEARLPQNQFLRVHRSYIVSLARITAFTFDDVEINRIEIPISRSYKEMVLKRLEPYKE